MEHIVPSIRSEYAKIDKPLTKEEMAGLGISSPGSL
jgi:hypothetical protein